MTAQLLLEMPLYFTEPGDKYDTRKPKDIK